MICEHAKWLIGSGPAIETRSLFEHLQSCPDCVCFRQQMLELETQLRRAFAFDGFERSARRPLARSNAQRARSPSRWRFSATTHRYRVGLGSALAAMLLAGLALWPGQPRAALAAEVIQHVENEPASWSSGEVPAESVAAILRSIGVQLNSGLASTVVYARNCSFRQHLVAHLVIATDSGPMTLLVLPRIATPAPVQFHSDSYSGLFLPMARGSVVVITRQKTLPEQLTTQVQGSFSEL